MTGCGRMHLREEKERIIQILAKYLVPTTGRHSCYPPTVLLKGSVLQLILFSLLSPNERMQGDESHHAPRVPPTQCQAVFKWARPGLLHDSLELLLFLGLSSEQQEGTSKEVLPWNLHSSSPPIPSTGILLKSSKVVLPLYLAAGGLGCRGGEGLQWNQSTCVDGSGLVNVMTLSSEDGQTPAKYFSGKSVKGISDSKNVIKLILFYLWVIFQMHWDQGLHG